jgi:hypothetical protein
MSFLTVNKLNDRLTHKQHFETIEQHKYARLAMASYYFDNQEYVVNELFSPMQELDGFILDKELSTENHSIFHNERTGEVVIAYRGTSNLNDIKTDAHIFMGREKNTQRFKESEEVFEKTRDKYGKSTIRTTGHSLGGGIALHIGEKVDIPSFTFNPAISATQVFSKNHYNNKTTQNIYHTEVDPVSVGGHVIGDHQPKRKVHKIANSPSNHAHALENFYSNDAKRTQDNRGYEVKKETLKTTIERHKSAFKRIYDAYEKVQNVEEYLDTINSDADVFTKLPKAVPKAYQMARRGASPHDYSKETAKNLNPFFGFNPDIDGYQWDDEDVITPLYRLGQLMRTTERRRQDALIALQPAQPQLQYTQPDEHHLLSSRGVRYEQVFGQSMLPPPTNRRRVTADYQVITPSMLQGARTDIDNNALIANLG